jgi:Cytochrome c554 and c-prime
VATYHNIPGVLNVTTSLPGWPRFILYFPLLLLLAACDVRAAGSSNAPASSMSFQPTDITGDASCLACHKAQTTSYLQTAHHFTSRAPSRESIKGKFTREAYILRSVNNSNLWFQMETTERGFFQTAALRSFPAGLAHRTERIDVVIGSGRKGQSYAFWEKDELYQLPVSYWTELDEWVNSPGFPDGTAIFTRPITPRCLECHATSFQSLTPPINRYNQTSLMLGITCEKCHGPGREHVARYQSKTPPKSPADGAIINPARLSRDRQMDACALCHASGTSRPSVPALSFTPGKVLAEYIDLPTPTADMHVDVHGGHLELLKRSRCYQSSATLTCTTCHDVHTTQRDPKTFAAKCLSCHKVESCGQFTKLGHEIDQQCVQCHMPLEATRLIICSANGKQLQPQARNHTIAIYPEAKLAAGR